MHLKNKFFIATLGLFFVLTSCDKKAFFDEYQLVDRAWNKEDVKSFSVTPPDTLTRFDLYLNIRNNTQYPFNNLFVILKIHQPDSQVLVDTLEYQMARPDGTLLGSGFTDVKENKLLMRENFTFQQAGKYTIEVQQALRESGEVLGVQALEGISEIGLRIEKQE